MDPKPFAALLSRCLQDRAGTLPQALALDRKMIRNHFGLLAVAQHDDGAPHSIAVYDQREGTQRCEQTAAGQPLESVPALDIKIVTAYALQCQKEHAGAVVVSAAGTLENSLLSIAIFSSFTARSGLASATWRES
jgi:hypothetical protein